MTVCAPASAGAETLCNTLVAIAVGRVLTSLALPQHAPAPGLAPAFAPAFAFAMVMFEGFVELGMEEQ